MVFGLATVMQSQCKFQQLMHFYELALALEIVHLAGVSLMMIPQTTLQQTRLLFIHVRVSDNSH